VGNFIFSGKKHECRLILLGTVHTDRLGFARTWAFLREYKPDLVLLELSPFGLQYRKEHARVLRRTFFANLRRVAENFRIDFTSALMNSHITGIIIQIGLPFEYRASVAYTKHSGTKIVLVDDSEFSREWTNTWSELISPENLATLLQLETEVIPAPLYYERAASGIAGESVHSVMPGGVNLRPWQRREDYIAAQILSALKTNAPRRPVYIGGWRHLISGGELKTIRDILSLEASSCLLLDRASDSFRTSRYSE
jgi:hypothetical protein